MNCNSAGLVTRSGELEGIESTLKSGFSSYSTLVSSDDWTCGGGCKMGCEGPGGIEGIRLLLKVMKVCCSADTGESFGGGSVG